LLEFAVQAAHAAGLPGAGRALELRGTAFLAPVVGDGPRQVRVLLNPMADVHRFRVQARPAGSNEPWTDHATGTVGATDIVTAPHLPDLQERLPSKTKSGLAGWIKFGPRWATITTTSGSDHERLARLILPEQYHADFADHPVHPALLDVAAGVLTDLTAGKAYAPFLYRRILVQDRLTPDLTVHARFTEGGRHPRPVDFDIYDTPTGRLLLRAEAFTMRAVAAQSGFSPVAQPKPADPTPSTGLLSPTDGGQAFLELLDPDMPPVVLVDLPANRLTVTGIPRLDPLRQPELPPPPPPVAAPAPVTPAPATSRPNGDDALDRLRTLWSDALGVTDIATDADFFDLGGNSLAAVQLAARISAAFGIELSAGTLFDAGTIDTLAEEVRALTS
jgi:acyl carrier protein